MNMQISVEGRVVLSMEVDISAIRSLFTTTVLSTGTHKSNPMTVADVSELLGRVDTKSAHFLTKIGANNGAITWGATREIFHIDDWASFAASYGKGITRAVRFVLGDKSAKLVWRDEDEWDGSDSAKLYVDGPALEALRQANGGASNMPGAPTEPTSPILPRGDTPPYDVMAGPMGPEQKWWVTRGLPTQEQLFIEKNGNLEALAGATSRISPNKLISSLDLLVAQLSDAGRPWTPANGMVVRNQYDQGTLLRRSDKWEKVIVGSSLHAPPGRYAGSPEG
jgi:hypothetical protein